jgi:hypothetical protein
MMRIAMKKINRVGIQMVKGSPLICPYRQAHPERRPGEVYLGPILDVDIDKLLWKSARVGQHCLNALGEEYVSSLFRPVFVRASEMRKALGFRRVGYLPEEGGNAQ